MILYPPFFCVFFFASFFFLFIFLITSFFRMMRMMMMILYPPFSLISSSYSVAAFSANAFGLFLKGHNGSGKTMLAVEAVNIKSAGLKNVIVYALTNNVDLPAAWNYELLNQDLEKRWFHDQKNVHIQHMTDFIKNFVQEHGHDFSSQQKQAKICLTRDTIRRITCALFLKKL